MADFPRAPTKGSAAIAGQIPAVYAGGHTVNAPTDSMWRAGIKLPTTGTVGFTMSRALSVTDIIKNIRTAVGVVPANVTVIGFIVKSADLDGGTPALVQSIYLGESVAVTGVTVGQGATAGIFPCVPTRVTADTPIYLNTTTAAATPQAGTVYVTALYHS
jgi:hypothetical protein